MWELLSFIVLLFFFNLSACMCSLYFLYCFNLFEYLATTYVFLLILVDPTMCTYIRLAIPLVIEIHLLFGTSFSLLALY
jgi:hypothetical protein